MSVNLDFDVTHQIQAQWMAEQKYCEICNISFSTIREGIAHFVDKHEHVQTKQLGHWEIKKYILMPYTNRERTARYIQKVFYKGEEIGISNTPYPLETFIRGAAWFEAMSA